MTKHTHSSLQIYLTGLGTATLLATTSNAAIIMMDVSSISGDNGGTTGFLDVSFSSLTNGGLAGGMTLVNHGGWYTGIWPTGSAMFATTGGYASPKQFLSQSQDIIDSSSNFTVLSFHCVFLYNTSGSYVSPNWGAGSYMGFVTGSGTDLHYGWLEVTWDADTSIFQILSGAYESEANVGIVAGAIPEPSSLALLAAGAAGVAALRRKKKAA